MSVQWWPPRSWSQVHLLVQPREGASGQNGVYCDLRAAWPLLTLLSASPRAGIWALVNHTHWAAHSEIRWSLSHRQLLWDSQGRTGAVALPPPYPRLNNDSCYQLVLKVPRGAPPLGAHFNLTAAMGKELGLAHFPDEDTEPQSGQAGGWRGSAAPGFPPACGEWRFELGLSSPGRGTG